MRPRLLDLFCGAGGASMGYHRAGFEVYGVDINAQPNYPFKFYMGDAMEVLRILSQRGTIQFNDGNYYWLGDFHCFHASPPCQGYVDRNCNRETKHPRLIEPIRELLEATDSLFIIENVYKAPLRATLMLCGTMFGLRVIRHRYFEFNFTGHMSPYTCNHNGSVANGEFVAVYLGGYHLPTLPDGTRPFAKDRDINTWSEAMGIDWMKYKTELKEAIPPAYTEYIGKYLMEVILDE